MRKVCLVILLLIPLLILAACGGKTLEFSGESSHWYIIYQVEIMSDDRQSESLIIKYIGNDPAPTTINYEVSNGKNGNDITSTNGVFNGGHTSCSGCSITRESQQFEATIEWNGKSETMILKVN